MKIMHNPQIDIRVKFEEYLGNSRELVNLSYGSNNMDERRFYVGISYLPTHCDTENDSNIAVYSPNRYDVITYDAEANIFECNYKHLDYATALHFMQECILRATTRTD